MAVEQPRAGWRTWAGLALFATSIVWPVLIPVLLLLGISASTTAAISGVMVVVAELMLIAGAALAGKEGFAFIKARVFGVLRAYGPPHEVSRPRYTLGLAMFAIPLVFGWISPYMARRIPMLSSTQWIYPVAFDVMLLISLFVLGGGFWDKLRSLFWHEAYAVLPERYPRGNSKQLTLSEDGRPKNVARPESGRSLSQQKDSINSRSDKSMAIEPADRNLLFGLIAMQSDLIDMRQFVDACTLWGSRKDSTLADVLIEQSWLEEEDRQHVDYLLKRRMKKADGDVKKSLAAMPDDLKVALESIDDGAIRQSLAGIEAGDRVATGGKISPTDSPDDRITRRGLHSTGGIGHVWLSHDKVLDREIALKELKAGKAESAITRERFFREAQITAQLTHPGVVPVYDYVDDAARSYYTMKFVRGRTFGKQIEDYHKWRRDSAETGVTSRLIELLNQFVCVCNTIAYAHSRQILHRDLKPENIVVGDFGEVIVLDWGLAKRTGEQDQAWENSEQQDFAATIDTANQPESPGITHTMQGEKLGTPAYMSPEQARGEVKLFDERTDVYGLAAILYEILVGEPPFSGKSIVAVLEKVIHDRPPPPADQIAGIPQELEATCLRGLSKKRDDRQQTAASIGNSVQTWIAERAERRRTEQERERFFNLSLDLLAIVTASGKLTLTNPAWQSVLGWTPEDLLGKPVWDLIAADDHERALKNHETLLAGQALTEMEYRCSHREGGQRWILWNAKRIPGESSIYLVGRDITERKHAEQTFQGLLESAPDAMVVINQSGTIVLANDQLERLFGYTRAELLGGPIELLVPEQFRAGHPQKVANFMKDAHARPMGAGLQLRGQRKDGTIFPVEISLGPVETEQGMLVSAAVRDVSERRKEQKKLQGILDATPDAMVVVDRDRRIVLVNSQVQRIFGYAQEELVGQTIETLIPERYREGHPQKFRAYVESPRFRPMGAGLELLGRCKDGSEFPVEISLSPLETEEGLLLISTIRDVSDRKRAEAMFAAILESAPDAMVVVDADRRIKLVNSQTERLFGYDRSEMIGNEIEMLIPERFRSGHPEKFASYLSNPHFRAMGAGLELFARRRDGSEFFVEISLSPVTTGDGLLVSSAIRDISDRKKEQNRSS